ncbi:2-C-methyl-D-erythritol 4-phosphate cytidylyltransferase [candidate division KSB1 bacterium]
MSLETNSKTAAVIPAAGQGIRFGQKKQFSYILDHPVIVWSIETLYKAGCIDGIVIAAPENEIEVIKNDLLSFYPDSKNITFVSGGETRQESVFNGLRAVPEEIEIVAIHDAVRPAVSVELVTKLITKAEKYGAALPSVNVTDSTFFERDNIIQEYVGRSNLRHAQTPQVFRKDDILAAHKRAAEDNYKANDDGDLYNEYVGDVYIIEGEIDNIKITYQDDILKAEKILKQKGYKIER